MIVAGAYERCRDLMGTGDLIAFSGKGHVSGVIKKISKSQYSHVGLVFRMESGVYLAESTTLSDVPCAISGKARRGAQLVPLSKRLRLYDGDAWWAPYEGPQDSDRSAKAREKVLEWIREEVPYDTVQAIGAGIDFWDFSFMENEPDFSSLFCSELCARYYQIRGALPDSSNPSEALPYQVTRYEFIGSLTQIA